MTMQCFDEPWMNYKHHVVRQLAFAIASPNIICQFPDSIRLRQDILLRPSDFWQQCFIHYRARLAQLDQDPSPLIQFLQQQKSTRLGLRFEALLWFWLQDPSNHDFRLLAHGLQFHHQGHTIGEIDFLVQNRHSQAIEHWEVCLKYYFSSADLDIHAWSGLNPTDRFFAKLNHLNQQQFRFADALGFAIQQRHLVIKGQLFLAAVHSQLPAWINPDRRTGQLYQHIPRHLPDLRCLSRQEWLCPANQMPLTPILRWDNGLYYQASTALYLMLYLADLQPDSPPSKCD